MKVFSWLINAFFIMIIGMLLYSYFYKRSPGTVMEYLTEDRLGLNRYVKHIPTFRVQRYLHYWKGGEIVDRYRIKFNYPLDADDISTMDSLSRAEDHKSLSGWDHDPIRNSYSYWFNDIALDCQDSIVFFPDENCATYIFRQFTRLR